MFGFGKKEVKSVAIVIKSDDLDKATLNKIRDKLKPFGLTKTPIFGISEREELQIHTRISNGKKHIMVVIKGDGIDSSLTDTLEEELNKQFPNSPIVVLGLEASESLEFHEI